MLVKRVEVGGDCGGVKTTNGSPDISHIDNELMSGQLLVTNYW